LPSATTALAPARRNSTASGSPPGCTSTRSGRSGACWPISSTNAATERPRGILVEATTTSASPGSSTSRHVPAISKRWTAAGCRPTPRTPAGGTSGCSSSSTGSSSRTVVIDASSTPHKVGRRQGRSSAVVADPGFHTRRSRLESGQHSPDGLVPQPSEEHHHHQHDKRPHPGLEECQVRLEEQNGDRNQADEAPHRREPLDRARPPHRRLPTRSRTDRKSVV